MKKAVRILLAAALMIPAASGALEEAGRTEVRSHELTLEISPDSHSLRVEAVMTLVQTGPAIRLRLNAGYTVSSVILDGRPAEFLFPAPAEKKPRRDTVPEERSHAGPDSSAPALLDVPSPNPGPHRLTVVYSGTVRDVPTTSEFSREYVANQSSGTIGPEGAFLSPGGFFYPRGDEETVRFTVHTRTPAGYETVTQGERIRHETVDGRLLVTWKNDHPADSLFLQAGPYSVRQTEVDGITIFTFFFHAEDSPAELYLRKSAEYIRMYNELLGRYPYPKFAVVENFFETGYGMPSWTLLGKTVVRLPFIPDTSLPHEICHNWWGNGVFVDDVSGNWCEGLTVYCADYLLKNRTPGGGAEYRRQINRDYSSYVREGRDFPLSRFRARFDPASRAVGYGKAMMAFHDLARRMGNETFFRSLRRLMEGHRFRRAGWPEVLAVFRKESGLSLEGWLDQWVERAGGPVLRLSEIRLEGTAIQPLLRFRIEQDDPPFSLSVPVRVETSSGPVEREFKISGLSTSFSWPLDSAPLRMEADPDHDLFRRLYPEEIPPSLAKAFGTEKQVIVLAGRDAAERPEIFKEAAEMLNRTRTGTIRSENEVTGADLDGAAVFILGRPAPESPLEVWLKAVERPLPWTDDPADDPTACEVAAFDHPRNPDLAVLVIRGGPQSNLLSVVRKLPHYGKYGRLLFRGETNTERGIWEVERSPLIRAFR